MQHNCILYVKLEGRSSDHDYVYDNYIYSSKYICLLCATVYSVQQNIFVYSVQLNPAFVRIFLCDFNIRNHFCRNIMLSTSLGLV